MNAKSDIRSSNAEKVAAQVRPATPDAIVELIARQLDRADEAAERIEREGSVVRDMKGGVVSHPAIVIEQQATKLACDLIEKHKRNARG